MSALYHAGKNVDALRDYVEARINTWIASIAGGGVIPQEEYFRIASTLEGVREFNTAYDLFVLYKKEQDAKARNLMLSNISNHLHRSHSAFKKAYEYQPDSFTEQVAASVFSAWAFISFHQLMKKDVYAAQPIQKENSND